VQDHAPLTRSPSGSQLLNTSRSRSRHRPRRPLMPREKTLEHALPKSLRIRNEATKSLCSSVRRFRDATIKAECKSDYPHALQALWKALVRAEDLIQS
jgi:hypothetical protein